MYISSKCLETYDDVDDDTATDNPYGKVLRTDVCDDGNQVLTVCKHENATVVTLKEGSTTKFTRAYTVESDRFAAAQVIAKYEWRRYDNFLDGIELALGEI